MELPDTFWMEARHVLYPEKEEAGWQDFRSSIPCCHSSPQTTKLHSPKFLAQVKTMTDEEFSGILENFFRKGATWTLYRAYCALSDSVALIVG